MKLPALLLSDPHFTASKADEYRWGVWPWLRGVCAKEHVRTLGILGDLTDAKDYHPAELVNRLVKEITLAQAQVEKVMILKGNHDYLKDGHAYFEFLSHLPGVQFVNSPHDSSSDGAACLWLPHTKTPRADWQGGDYSHYQFVFMHQTVRGALSSNGMVMDGESLPEELADAGKIYSGDIHVPQVIGDVEYVGSPYHVHFGDSFRPRCVLVGHGGVADDRRFRTISRLSATLTPDELMVAPELLKLREGDQIKVHVELTAAEMHDWQRIKREGIARLVEAGVEVHAFSLVPPKHRRRFADTPRREVNQTEPAGVVTRFVEREDLGGEVLHVGLELL